MSHSSSKAFTLIELMVCVGIMLVILSVIFLNQSSYTEVASLNNTTDDLSLNIRESQVYGVAVKELTPGSSNFTASYGVAVSLLASGSNASYIRFADTNSNTFYDGNWSCPQGSNSECLEQFTLERGN